MELSAHELWRKYVNPQMVRLLESFDFGRRFVRAEGATLYDDTGRAYTDFLSGFGVHNIGHNHPTLVAALGAAIASGQPSMLNIDAAEAPGHLARDLCEAMHPDLCRTIFANSGSEAVEVAIRACRAAAGRAGLLACDGAFHGVTTGALSLMGSEQHRALFPSPSQGVHFVAYGNSAALEQAVATHRPAAFFVEPVQGEGGIRMPGPAYLEQAGGICRRRGCLLVVDEIQTGLGRCGSLFVTDFARVRPDVVLVGKALSGGMVPVSAAVMTDRVWRKAFGTPLRCQMATTTFAGGLLATIAGRTTLQIVRDEELPSRARRLGAQLADELGRLATEFPMIEEVRGVGLLAGVKFRPPAGLLSRAVPAWARRGLYSHVLAALLLRDHGIITQPCSLDPSVLRFEPPLVIGEAEIPRVLGALETVLRAYPSYGVAVRAAFSRTVLKGKL